MWCKYTDFVRKGWYKCSEFVTFVPSDAIKRTFFLTTHMEKTRCTLCLGSNTEAETNLEKARAMLAGLLPDIRWEEARWTEPVDFPYPALFLNQLATFCTDMTRDRLRQCFKTIERQCGRLPEDKAQGIVRMDIDLLTYGDEQLKGVPFLNYG